MTREILARLDLTQRILIATLLAVCALAVIFVVWHNERSRNSEVSERVEANETRRELLAITETDHTLNPGRRVSVVVYEDPDCPICRAHARHLKQTLAERNDATIAWRYHFIPIYPDSYKEALVLECASAHDPAAFEPLKEEFLNITSSFQYDEDKLLARASRYAPLEYLRTCINSTSTGAHIDQLQNQSSIVGVQPVPHTFIFSDRSPIYEFLGTQSSAYIHQLIDAAAAYE